MNMLVAIIGRPNVGKSTLFNRLTETNLAIVDDIPGVTRDRQYGWCEWGNKRFLLVDTGGFQEKSSDVFQPHITRQIEIALEECDAVFFVTDGKEGLTDADKEIGVRIRKYAKPVFVIVNKCDTPLETHNSAEFYQLGFDKIYPVSAINGSGTGELLEDVKQIIPEKAGEEEQEIPRLAIVGRPNVGKSSLINTLMGEERVMVSPVSGTTRDSVDSYLDRFNHRWILVDTAGLRKKSKVNEDIEFYSSLRTWRAIDRADVCVLMLDAQQGIESQDLTILSRVLERRKPVILVVNKWDLVEKNTKTAKEWEENIRNKTAPFRDYDIVFSSVHEKQRLLKILDLAKETLARYSQDISVSELNEFFLPLIENQPPPIVKGKEVKVKYVSKVKGQPIFMFYCNLPQYVSDTYRRFLENKLREKWNFRGVPIVISFRKK